MRSVRDRVGEQLAWAREQDGKFHALIAVLDEEASRAAETLDAATGPRGILHGLTVSVKDNIDVAGVPSTAGSAWHGHAPAESDATVVRLLREAGAVLMGKNNMAEFAMGATGRNAAFGDCRNAWDTARIPGGSSSGSAVAVATGMSTVSLGTDTGGSGRIPASVNGVVGVRPTVGRLANRGVLPVSPSFDTIAPMARDVRTVAAVLAALDRPDPAAVAGRRVPVDSLLDAQSAPWRIGVPRNYFFEQVDPAVLGVFRHALDVMRDHGAQVREVTVPEVADAQDRMLDIMYPEAAEIHAERLRRAPGEIDPDVLRRLRAGLTVPPGRTAAARVWQRHYRHGVDGVFEGVDVIATPTIPVDVPLRDAVDLAASTRDIARFTYAWSMYGGPSISVPCGRHPRSGMPVGMQFTAARWHEHVLLHAALRCERALGPLPSPVTG